LFSLSAISAFFSFAFITLKGWDKQIASYQPA
jgi:hypothetical protein